MHTHIHTRTHTCMHAHTHTHLTSNSLTRLLNKMFFLHDSSNTFKALSKLLMYWEYICRWYYSYHSMSAAITLKKGAVFNIISPILGTEFLQINKMTSITWYSTQYQLANLSSSWFNRPLLRTYSDPTLDRIALRVSSASTGLSWALLADSTLCLNSCHDSTEENTNLYCFCTNDLLILLLHNSLASVLTY